MSAFPNLFKPARIAKLRLKNRVVMLPMGSVFASPEGSVTERTKDHYVRRAKGGVGLITVGNILFDLPVGRNGFSLPSLDNDRCLPGHYEMVEAVHAYGARIAAQLNHPGRQTTLEYTGGLTPVSASPIPCRFLGKDPMPTPRALESWEIYRVISLLVAATRRAKAVGYDMVEIHGAHGYLFSSFMSPYMNKRNDEFGGSLENRMRFPLEAVRAIKEVVGDEYPISFRFSVDEFLEGGITLEESPAMARMLEEAGVAVISVSTGVYETHNKMEDIMRQPEGWKRPIWQAIKDAVNIPVIAGGGIKTPEFGETLLADSVADFVGLARPLLADPDWPRKAAEGHPEDIRRCISCQCCVGGRAPTPRRGVPRCAVNAEWGREREFAELKPASPKKRVMVIGAGPGGMEAARIAASRGHEVTLYDKGKELGGLLLLAGRPPGKEKVLWLRDYLVTQIRKLGVKVRMGTEVTPEVVEQAKPDAVVIAAGSEPLIPDIPGIADKKVVTAWDVLTDKVKLENSRVAVIGGGNVGCETAELLAEAGNTITILEMLPVMAYNMDPDNGAALLESLEKKGVTMLTEREVREITPDGLVCGMKGSQDAEGIQADWIVVALGAKPNRSLADALEGRVPELHVIGDCNEPRIIMEAIYEGSLAGRMI